MEQVSSFSKLTMGSPPLAISILFCGRKRATTTLSCQYAGVTCSAWHSRRVGHTFNGVGAPAAVVSNRYARSFHTAKATYDMAGSPIMLSAQRPLQDCLSRSRLRRWCVEGCELLLWYARRESSRPRRGRGAGRRLEAPPAIRGNGYCLFQDGAALRNNGGGVNDGGCTAAERAKSVARTNCTICGRESTAALLLTILARAPT